MAAVDRYLLWRLVAVVVAVVFEMSWRHISDRLHRCLQATFGLVVDHPVGVKMPKLFVWSVAEPVVEDLEHVVDLLALLTYRKLFWVARWHPYESA